MAVISSRHAARVLFQIVRKPSDALMFVKGIAAFSDLISGF
jgi:hypothetical protein